MRIGSLFSGIGGLELGLERTGVGSVAWQVELDPFRRRILERHWPGARRHADVTLFHPETEEHVDVVCGGFPCQPFSAASRGRRTLDLSLWRHFARIVRESRASIVVVENVANHAAGHWLPAVLADLRDLGYRARALRLDAREVGAPHRRARIFVVARLADPHEEAQPARAEHAEVAELPRAPGDRRDWREPLPGALRVAHGLPRGVDRARPLRRGDLERLRALGDAVVPAVAEVIGRVVLLDLAEAGRA